jgi:hypothetical protein
MARGTVGGTVDGTILQNYTPHLCKSQHALMESVLVIMTSVVAPSSAPLCYTPVRSVFTAEERLQQTLETVASVRSAIPGCTVWWIEGGRLSAEQHATAEKAADAVLMVTESPFADSPFKGLNEAYLLQQAFNAGDVYQFSAVFKLSGRYTCTPDFDPTVFDSDDSCVLRPTPSSAVTILFKIASRDIAAFQANLERVKPALAAGASIEDVLFDDGATTTGMHVRVVPRLGVTGRIAVTGHTISW